MSLCGKRIGIWGWWQGHNLGDNWIKSVMTSIFPGADFIDTNEKGLDKYDYVICGGGGLFIYDVISPFDQIDIGTPYGVLGLGAEFEHTSEIAKNIENKADFFFVRDVYSQKCMHLSTNSRSYDITFYSPLKWIKREKIERECLFFVWREGDDLIRNEKFREYIEYKDCKEEWLSIANRNFKKIVFNDFQTDNHSVEEDLSKCGFVISGRYHGIVAAIQKGLPFIAIDICPKIRAIVRECGLEEYCVKISETEKIATLIKKATENIDGIREKEKKYLKKANLKLIEQILYIKTTIFRRLIDIKILYYGSYWMGENDVVKVMSDDLKKVCDAEIIDLKEYEENYDSRISEYKKTPNGTICTLDSEKILKDIDKYEANAIVLNSGGLHFNEGLIRELKKRGVSTIGMSLSDPDVFPYNGHVYAKDFDLYYSNSKFAIENQYGKDGIDALLLPFAASTSHHYPMDEVEKKYDVVVVGHCREDRKIIVRRLKEFCNVGVYGDGWKEGNGVVTGINQIKAINTGKMYLSFGHTRAGYENVKVGLFEAMACKQLVIASYCEEIADYFEIGKEIVCYKSVEELVKTIKYLLNHHAEREEIRENGYRRFLQYHTYQSRWMDVIEEICRVRETSNEYKRI